MPNYNSPTVSGDPHRSPASPYSTARVADAAEEPDTSDPKTKGLWMVKEQDDGSWWVMGPDPQDGELVLVAAFEMEKDARYVRDLHNDRVRGENT